MSKLYVVSIVQFDDGKEDREIIAGVKPGMSDKVHHARIDEANRFWNGWKRVVSSSYQVFPNLVDALTCRL